MKRLFNTLAIALVGLFAHADIYTVEVTKTPQFVPAGKILQVQALSSVASGTATVKSVSSLPVIENREVVTAFTNFTYSSNFTSNGVHLVVTNMTVTAVTNVIPTATSIATVTNALSDTVTCASGVGTANPSNKFTIPNDPIFYEGTAAGRVLVIIEK